MVEEPAWDPVSEKMNDLFSLAASRAEQRRKAEGTTVDLAEIVRQRKEEAARAEERKRQKEYSDRVEFEKMLEETRLYLGKIGRPVESFFINDGCRVIVAHRKNEAVRVEIQGIHDPMLRRIACAQIITAVAGY